MAIHTRDSKVFRERSADSGENGASWLVRTCLDTKERTVAVGDVVWLADQNALRGQYTLARVVSVNTDGKGTVRDVTVRPFPS